MVCEKIQKKKKHMEWIEIHTSTRQLPLRNQAKKKTSNYSTIVTSNLQTSLLTRFIM